MDVPDGYRVRVRHERPVRGDVSMEWATYLEIAKSLGGLVARHDLVRLGLKPSAWLPNGGRTVVTILYPDTAVVAALGEARCSDRDSFCRRRGREIALGRALKVLTP